MAAGVEKMLIRISNLFSSVYNLLRSCGYAVFRDSRTGETSYTRRLGGFGFYPRFHIYVSRESAEEIELNLHLDQKKASYEGQRAHSGEYDSEFVIREAERIKQAARRGAVTESKEKPRKGFWSRVFGK